MSAWELGDQHGYRNAQSTVLAPTGTIGFMMDCDTTGVEPDIALVKYKKLRRRGIMKIVNGTVRRPAEMGYTELEIKEVIDYIDENETIEGAPHLKTGPARLRLCVQAVARGPVDPLHGPHQDDGRRAAVHFRGHFQDRQRPKAATVEEIEQAYIDAWRNRRKGRVDFIATAASARSRSTRPATNSRRADVVGLPSRTAIACRTSDSRLHTSSRSPDTRLHHLWGSTRTVTRRAVPDDGQGRLDDLGFCRRVRAGHQLRAAVRRAAQDLVDKFSHVRFEPAGMTKIRHPALRSPSSITSSVGWRPVSFTRGPVSGGREQP